jgi:Ca-activated chloride channel homolog
VLVPLAVFAYIRAQRRRARYAVRFTNLDLLANIVEGSPGWRRHVPAALYLLAVAALAIALARPQAEISFPREQATVVLTSDSSGSMQATDVAPNRLQAAKAAAITFLERVPEKFRVGLISFDDTVDVLSSPTTDRDAVRNEIDGLLAEGGTAMGDAIHRSLQLVRARRGERGSERTPAAVLLLSDGAATTGRDPERVARRAKRLGVPVHTVALGTPDGSINLSNRFGAPQQVSVPPDRETLRRVAEISGGRYSEAPTEGELNSVYEQLSSQIGFVTERQEVTAVFAAAGLLLLLAGGTLSLLWFNRIP